MNFETDGFAVFDRDPRVARWATRAHAAALAAVEDPAMGAAWLRHGETWFVGVDALDNTPDGAVEGVPLAGPWAGLVAPPATWHRAQLSVVYRGFPQRDPDETLAAHRYRIKRAGAHVDGLHLEGGRRIVREYHSFILGLPLNHALACPLVVWPKSHVIMRAALRATIGERGVAGADVTDLYKAARAQVFKQIEPVEVRAVPGQSILLDRHIVHGVAADDGAHPMPHEGRMVAYFRPPFEDPERWLRG